MYRWLASSLEQVGGTDVVRQSFRLTLEYTAMLGALLTLTLAVSNLQVALVSLLSLDRYAST